VGDTNSDLAGTGGFEFIDAGLNCDVGGAVEAAVETEGWMYVRLAVVMAAGLCPAPFDLFDLEDAGRASAGCAVEVDGRWRCP